MCANSLGKIHTEDKVTIRMKTDEGLERWLCWLRVHFALTKDLSLVPITPVCWMATSCNSNPTRFNAFFWPLKIWWFE